MIQALLNSVIVSGSITLGTVFFCTLAGFAFAKLRFRLQHRPPDRHPRDDDGAGAARRRPALHPDGEAGSWANHLQAVIFPTLVSAFGVVFMRQYLSRALPNEIIEAAVVDGASIVSDLPLDRAARRPAGDGRPRDAHLPGGLERLLLADHRALEQNPTVQVALNGLGQGYVPDRSIILAGTLVGTVPVLIVFALLGKHIVGGIMEGAVKG